MNEIESLSSEILDKIYYEGIQPLIVEKENYAYIKDPVFEIKRNRVVAEVLNSVISSNLEISEEIVRKLCNFLLKNQNKNGSWNEIHTQYHQQSSLITSIVGDALLLCNNKLKDKNIEKSVHSAKDYVVSQEKSPGYFIKSKQYTADHLNVDATCGAFLSSYGKFFSDEACLKAASRAARHICDHQISDGSYPYIISKRGSPNLFYVPCIHYQGVTLYYLSKINEIIDENWLNDSIQGGIKWLAGAQKKDGSFDWSKSGLLFAYYLSGAYAFAFSSFLSTSQQDDTYVDNAFLCLQILKRNVNGLVLRWERSSWSTFPFSFPSTFKTAFIGDSPLKHSLFKFGYGMYRQMARRRYSTFVDDGVFHALTKRLHVTPSTIEPFSNYSDLFMTSEIMDCLSYVEVIQRVKVNV